MITVYGIETEAIKSHGSTIVELERYDYRLRY